MINCFFHLRQSVQCCIQKSFKVKYRTDKSFALASRLVVFLAIVPLEQVNQPKPSVQEYFRAIRDQQVTTDYHLDRLAAGMTPAKKRKTTNHVLHNNYYN